ncbi:hypothetical protein SAMN02927900_01448 [Rhizobium mongolense subsp. loessense]|uniref:Uncharacterized protein n=2 Tax=Rhizobium mongolense TaxID=57676 RepID=A0A1G4Q7N1_9HYPH|nr:hypothetical protein SAMN02927900_01448 [Rhizobium mongolense subsp. loessense]
MNEDAEQMRRDWAAEKAATLHPRPAPIPRCISFALPKIEGADDMPAAIAAILQAVTNSEIVPSEAQSVVAIIEAHRKALETEELLKRWIWKPSIGMDCFVVGYPLGLTGRVATPIWKKASIALNLNWIMTSFRCCS